MVILVSGYFEPFWSRSFCTFLNERVQKKTLIIDLDPQAHSSCIYCDEINKDQSINVIFEKSDYNLKSLIHTALVDGEKSEYLDIIPSTIHLAMIAETANQKIFREKIIRKINIHLLLSDRITMF